MNHKFTEETGIFRRFGLSAFILACVALIFSNRAALRYAYEVFVSVHAIFAIVFVTLTWNHIPRQRGWLIATLSIWAIDRGVRWLRIIVVNGLWRFGSQSKTQTATLRLLSHDTTRLEVYKSDFPNWKPGAYAYISTPGLPWWPQSHPFTIASRPFRELFLEPGLVSQKRPSSASPHNNLVFLIRARSGWTRRLHQLAQQTSHPTVPVVIDGPYDSAPTLHVAFDTVLLFAGGAGISWTISLLAELVERARRAGRSNVQKVIFVSVIRSYVNYDWFFTELQNIVQFSGNAHIDVRIHYTTNTSPEDESAVPAFFRSGRPDIQTIIQQAVEQANGRVFIGVSGPAGPSQEVRRCARMFTNPAAILRGDARGDIYFHQELFGW